MSSDDDDHDGKLHGVRCVTILFSYWPQLLRLLLVAVVALLLTFIAVKRWSGMPGEKVIYKASNSGFNMGFLRGFGVEDEFQVHTLAETETEREPEAPKDLADEAWEDELPPTQLPVKPGPRQAEPLLSAVSGGADAVEIDEAETKELEETKAFMKMYKTLNPESEISRLAPVQLKMKLCGSFVQQRLQMISILLAGVSIGAQVILPEGIGAQQLPIGDLFAMEEMRDLIQKVYIRHWCTRRLSMAHGVWCPNVHIPGILTAQQLADFYADHKIVTETFPLAKNLTVTNFTEFQNLGESIWNKRFPKGFKKADLFAVSNVLSVDVDCHFYKRVRVAEADVAFRKFWKLEDSLVWNERIIREHEKFRRKIFHDYGAVASQRAKLLGFSHPQEPKFTVLELRNDLCTEERCPDLGNILLSEGVYPGLPLYVAFSTADAVKQYQSRMAGGVLETVFTVVTKDMLTDAKEAQDDITWAAFDFTMAQAAGTFVGPSRSTSSSFMLLSRVRSKLEAFHYDGQVTLLEADGILRPKQSTAVEVFRTPLKWMFSLSSGARTSSAWNMTMAAVRSASSDESLVPLCLTDAAPTSELAQGLVQLGVRVLYHRPQWMGKMKPIFNRWKKKSDKKWKFAFPDFDGTRGSMLRIDIPILGLIDHFVLYTDVDVLFQRRLTWKELLPSGTESGAMTADGHLKYAKPGDFGLPEFFAMTTEFVQSSDPENMDTGVMLLNLGSLKETYQNFIDFLFNPSRAWDFNTSDPCGYKAYYRSKGKLVATFLPFVLNWKFYWTQEGDDSDPIIMHFHGPKCETDIVPFAYDGQVRHEPFRKMLQPCSNGRMCQKLCKQYQAELNAAYKLLSPTAAGKQSRDRP